MMLDQEAVQSHFPVHETGSFTADEIQEILSLLQSDTRVSPNSGSEVSNRSVYSVEERKRRRMVSNRESARRSRWRKKRHVEDLKNRLNQLRVENRVLKNRLGLVLNQYYVVERANDQLRSESVALWTTLSALYQIVVAMQSQ